MVIQYKTMKWHRLQSTSVDHWTLVVEKQMQTAIDVINCVALLQSSHSHAFRSKQVKLPYLSHFFQFNLILQHQTTCNVFPSITLVQQQEATRKPFLIFCYLNFNHNNCFPKWQFLKSCKILYKSQECDILLLSRNNKNYCLFIW